MNGNDSGHLQVACKCLILMAGWTRPDRVGGCVGSTARAAKRLGPPLRGSDKDPGEFRRTQNWSPVCEVMKGNGTLLPAPLSTHLLEDEQLQHSFQHGPITREGCGTEAERGACDARAAHLRVGLFAGRATRFIAKDAGSLTTQHYLE